MIACIVPGDLYAEENISTLAYASKVYIILLSNNRQQ